MTAVAAGRPRLKVCCIASVAEARLAIELGADAVGLVADMPSGPGTIGDGRIAEIAARVPAPVATFLLTSETEPAAVLEHVRRTGVNTVQLVDDSVDPGVHAHLQRSLPWLRIVQVVHVDGPAALDRAVAHADQAHALLLDSGSRGGEVPEFGGTGRTHDWSLSRRIVLASKVPVFLAGGLRPDNVAEAVAAVQPFGVDLCSGVRTEGHLDRDKLTAFVAALHRA